MALLHRQHSIPPALVDRMETLRLPSYHESEKVQIARRFLIPKQVKAAGRRMAAANRKPHIDKVFEILKALPDMAVFANEQELDDYLDAMQQRSRPQQG